MGVEPEEEFVSDDQLKTLLERWIAPDPSRVLDKRITTSFAREFSGADGLSQSVLLPHRREEVVSMKFCSTCQEEFADKFSFCPVDGNPLSVASPKLDDNATRPPIQDSITRPAVQDSVTRPAVQPTPAFVAEGVEDSVTLPAAYSMLGLFSRGATNGSRTAVSTSG